jgi:hypothetical protein
LGLRRRQVGRGCCESSGRGRYYDLRLVCRTDGREWIGVHHLMSPAGAVGVASYINNDLRIGFYGNSVSADLELAHGLFPELPSPCIVGL